MWQIKVFWKRRADGRVYRNLLLKTMQKKMFNTIWNIFLFYCSWKMQNSSTEEGSVSTLLLGKASIIFFWYNCCDPTEYTGDKHSQYVAFNSLNWIWCIQYFFKKVIVNILLLSFLGDTDHNAFCIIYPFMKWVNIIFK